MPAVREGLPCALLSGVHTLAVGARAGARVEEGDGNRGHRRHPGKPAAQSRNPLTAVQVREQNGTLSLHASFTPPTLPAPTREASHTHATHPSATALRRRTGQGSRACSRAATRAAPAPPPAPARPPATARASAGATAARPERPAAPRRSRAAMCAHMRSGTVGRGFWKSHINTHPRWRGGLAISVLWS